MKFIDLQTQTARVQTSFSDRMDRIFASASFINGPDVAEFEELSATYLGYEHGIGVASGTDALMITLMSLGVTSDSRVFLPAFTYTATAEVICLLGATPVFVDSEPDTFLMSCDALEKALSEYSRPRDIIMAVDLFGFPCDYDSIEQLATTYECDIVIDGAQSFGCSYKGARNIKSAKAFCTSFFPAKPLGCAGDGGAIYTDNEELAAIIRSIKNHGMGADKYDIKRIGVNGRLDTIQAAILIEKLNIFDSEVSVKTEIYAEYAKRFDGLLIPQLLSYENKSACAQAVFKIVDESITNVWLQNELKSSGIPTMIYYPKTVADQTAYRAKSMVDLNLDNARALTTRVIALPFHAYLSENDLRKIEENVLSMLS